MKGSLTHTPLSLTHTHTHTLSLSLPLSLSLSPHPSLSLSLTHLEGGEVDDRELARQHTSNGYEEGLVTRETLFENGFGGGAAGHGVEHIEHNLLG